MLGWVSRPSALSSRRCVWRLDQLCGLSEAEALVQGDPSDTDVVTLERLPTLLGATLLSARGEPLGQLADAAFERRTGRILHYLVARSDPRLPGGSRWRLSPERIVDQRAGEVTTALLGLSDLPLARASLRESLLRRSRRWREQWEEESGRLRDQWQQASGRFEERLEGWLEEPPWDAPDPERREPRFEDDLWPEEPWPEPESGDGWASGAGERLDGEPWLDDPAQRSGPVPRRQRTAADRRGRWQDERGRAEFRELEPDDWAAPPDARSASWDDDGDPEPSRAVDRHESWSEPDPASGAVRQHPSADGCDDPWV